MAGPPSPEKSGVKLLLDEEAHGREYAHAAVGQLRLAVAVDLKLGLTFEEVGRVEVQLLATEGVEVARQP